MSHEDFYPWFLGAYGENHAVVEELIVEAVRDHFFWRRNFHPESTPPIPTSAQYSESYQDFIATLKGEIYRLSADLKDSVPFFSPRYIGHMASDLLIPGIVGRIATLLYNPNHVNEDVAPATLTKELEVGEQLAAMLGFDLEGEVKAFGHMTSGGTVANYEGLRNLMAARYYPVAVGQAARDLGAPIEWRGERIADLPPERLANLSVTQASDLRRASLLGAEREGIADWRVAVEERRYEHMGLRAFLDAHPELGQPHVLVSTSGHYSWQKAMKLMGLGTANLTRVGVDSSMRLDASDLESKIETILASQDTILAVIPILGTTEFGALDPVDQVVDLRARYRERGVEFGLHLDAAWGGYLASLFRAPDASLRPHAEVAEDFRYFPTEGVHRTFGALKHVDSATVDPHKLAFIPYPAGAYVARDRTIIDFVSQDAAYVFDPDDDDSEDRFRMLGRYILEGSKPGAAVASVYLTHRTIPLNHEGFGKIIAESVRSCELFYDRAIQWREKMQDIATLAMPFEPDANIACFSIAPAAACSVSEANAFAEVVLARLSNVRREPVQNRSFMVSSTRLFAADIGERIDDMLEALGLDLETFGEGGADSILVFRHTLMNPWLQAKNEDGKTYIDLYFEHLETVVRELLA